MELEYKIEWSKPAEYDYRSILQKLPSPISRNMTEIYNYSIEDYGFYFLDNLVDAQVSGYAMKLFIDEALRFTDKVHISEI